MENNHFFNSLEENIKILKDRYREAAEGFRSENEQLLKENDSLKKENESLLKREHGKKRLQVVVLEETIEELLKENDSLKKENESLLKREHGKKRLQVVVLEETIEELLKENEELKSKKEVQPIAQQIIEKILWIDKRYNESFTKRELGEIYEKVNSLCKRAYDSEYLYSYKQDIFRDKGGIS